jgi:hypothetical protein
MRFRSVLAVFLAATLLSAGCRQPDGALPAETADDSNRLSDVTRDLLSIAGGDAKAPGEFADDLKVWGTRSDEAWPPGDELAKRLAASLQGKNLTEQSAGQLARQLWIAAAGRELSPRQVERLQEDVKGLLVSVGSSDTAAKDVADQVGEMQGVVSTKRRWWFQMF